MKFLASLVTGFAFMATAAFATPALAYDSNTYRNDITGFEITKPDAWIFATRNDNTHTYSGNNPIEAYLTINADIPQVMIARNRDQVKDVNPSIRIMAKPYGRLEGKDPIPMVSLTSMLMSLSLRNLETVEKPKTVELAGEEAGYTRVSYYIDTPYEKGVQVTQDIWIVKRPNFYFLIGAGKRSTHPASIDKEVEDILETFKLL